MADERNPPTLDYATPSPPQDRCDSVLIRIGFAGASLFCFMLTLHLAVGAWYVIEHGHILGQEVVCRLYSMSERIVAAAVHSACALLLLLGACKLTSRAVRGRRKVRAPCGGVSVRHDHSAGLLP